MIVTINDKVYEVPEDGSHLTISDYLQIINSENDFKAFSKYIGCSYNELRNIKYGNTQIIRDGIELCFIALNDELGKMAINEEKKPKKILGHNLDYDFGFRPYGCYIDAISALEQIEGEEVEDKFFSFYLPRFLVIYGYKEYEPGKVELREKEMLNANLLDAVRFHAFFLISDESYLRRFLLIFQKKEARDHKS